MASKRTSALRSKVVIGFVLVFSALLIAAYISYQSFNKLQNASQTISQPNKKIKRIDSILIAVTKTENTLQEYSVLRSSEETEEYSEKLEQYYVQVNEVEHIIESLESETQSEEHTLDSVLSLLRDKLVSLDDFREIKGQRDNFNFYDEALSDLESKVSNLASKRDEPHFLEDTTRQKTILRIKIPPWLSRKNNDRNADAIDEIPEEETTPITIAPDSVKQLLRQVRNDQARRQRQIDQQELTYLKNNAQVMGSIYTLVGQLKEQEQGRSQERVAEARTAMNEAIIRIAIILIVAFLSTIIIVYLILADITRSEFYRSKLLAAKSRAERLARVKEDFLANMSHEIRTPLTAILGFTEQMKFSRLNAQQQKYVGALESSSQHLMSLVNDILDFSKIEAGKINYEHAPFDIVRIIREVKHDLQLIANQKKLDLRYNLKGEENQYIMGDAFRLKQVLYNLVSNALKFTHEGEVLITANLRPLDNQQIQVVLEVVDTGIGIPKDKQTSIFDAFHQSDRSTTRKYGGTGLGLAICKRIIEGQQGSLSVESKEGAGSIFRVVINYDPASVNDIENSDEIKELTSVKYLDGEALIIDDNRLNVTLLELALDARGITSVCCHSGKEAIEAAEDRVFDIIFCDLHMPEMDGTQVIKALQENALVTAYNTPIIAFTANIQTEDRRKFEQLGIQSFLFKPFSQVQLDNILQEYLSELDTENLGIDIASSQSADSKSIINLSRVQQFTGEDTDALISYLETFERTAKEVSEKLAIAIDEKSTKEVSFFSHKLVSQVEFLQYYDLTKQLKHLESVSNNNKWYKELDQDVQKAINMISELIRVIQQEIEGLKSTIADKLL